LSFANPPGKSTVASPLGISTFVQTPFAISTFATGRWGNEHLQTHFGNRLLKPTWEIDFENPPSFQKEGPIAETIIFIFSTFSFVGAPTRR
jgi:hypothetical protein